MLKKSETTTGILQIALNLKEDKQYTKDDAAQDLLDFLKFIDCI